MPFSLRSTLIIAILIAGNALSVLPARADDPVDSFQQKAIDELQAAQKFFADSSNRLAKELVGREIDDHGKTFPQSLLEDWLKKPIDRTAGALKDQINDRVRLAKNDPTLTLAAYYQDTYRRIDFALGDQWTLALSEAGNTRAGRVQVLTAQAHKAIDRLNDEYEKERRALEARQWPSAAQRDAASAALEQKYRDSEVALLLPWATSYRAIAADLIKQRDELAGRMWRWQDIAFRRSFLSDDVHGRFAAQFKEEAYSKFQYLPAVRPGDLDFFLTYPGSPDRMILGTNHIHDTEIRFSDLEYDGPRLFKMGHLLSGSIDSLRRHDDDLPELSVSGTALEQHIRRLYGRLSQLKAVDLKMRNIEAALDQQSDEAERLTRVASLLKSYQEALTQAKSLAEAALAIDKQAQVLADAVKAAEKAVEDATKQQAKASRDRDDAIARLAVIPPADWANGAPKLLLGRGNANGKTITYEQAVKLIQGKISNYQSNPGVAGIQEKIESLQAALDSLAQQRVKQLAPFEEKLATSNQAVESAQNALSDAKREQEQQPKTKRPSEDEVRQAIASAKNAAQALRDQASAQVLKEIGLDMPALRDLEFGSGALTAPQGQKLLQSLSDALTGATTSSARLQSAVAKSTNGLEQQLADYAAASDLFETLRSHVQLLQKSGAAAAELALSNLTKKTGGDPALEKAVLKLHELASDLDQIVNPQRLLETDNAIAKKIRDNGWDQFTKRVKPLGKAVSLLKKAKGRLDDAAAIGDWILALQRRDPQSLSIGVKLIGAFAGRSSMVAPFVSSAIKFYADVSSDCIDAAIKLQKRVIDQRLEIAFSDKHKAPEQVLYTRARLIELLSDRIENPNAAGAVDQLALVLQVRRLTFLCTAAADTVIGNEP